MFQLHSLSRFRMVEEKHEGAESAPPPGKIGLNNALPIFVKNTPTICLILHQFNLYVLLICGKEIGDD